MCGRYVSVRSDGDVLSAFDAVDATDDVAVEPDYNVAPTKAVRAVVSRPLRDESGARSGDPVRQLRVMSWGLVPSWAKDVKIAAKMINARVEGIADKPAFGKAYAKRRCLIPADGWYEWRAFDTDAGPRKQPLYMTPTDRHPLAFAGLYEFWRGAGGPTLTTCAIITTPSQGALAEVHDRMPLLVPAPGWSRWLDPSVDDPADLLEPWDEADGERLELRPVSTAVNKVDNNGAELIAEAEPMPETPQLF
ncbi:MAG: SOS response-associated peptidase [Jatrophihabitantaceae bacterium]